MTDSPILCTIDLDAPGKQVGQAAGAALVERRAAGRTSTSRSSRSRGGEGPTALVLGGVHGDEPEGQVAALNLARELQPGAGARAA